MTEKTDATGLYHDDPDERITVVAWDEQGKDPIPLFAVETKSDGIEVAQELAELHKGRSRWTTIPLQRINSYESVTDLIPKPEDDKE